MELEEIDSIIAQLSPEAKELLIAMGDLEIEKWKELVDNKFIKQINKKKESE